MFCCLIKEKLEKIVFLIAPKITLWAHSLEEADKKDLHHYGQALHVVENIHQPVQIGSIYHRDEVTKSKKVFNVFEKPEILLNEFRRLIGEANSHKYGLMTRNKKEAASKEKSKGRAESVTTSTSLYQVPQQIEYIYDSHGCRGTQAGEYNVKEIENKVKESKKNFSYGRRMDLSKPLNFNPGPGYYDLIPLTIPVRELSKKHSLNPTTSLNPESIVGPNTERVIKRNESSI